MVKDISSSMGCAPTGSKLVATNYPMSKRWKPSR